jgi:hypothetical protein
MRRDGTIVHELYRDSAAQPNHKYSQGVSVQQPGKYDVLVTFDGGTAADLAFTVS